MVERRLDLGGKDRFIDLYGEPGGYMASMGSNFKDRGCPSCGTLIVKFAHGGGVVFLCPWCQVELGRRVCRA